MTFDEIYQQVKDLKGWMGDKDRQALYEYTSKIKNGLIVEIGCFMGISTKVMALSSPTSTIIAIDPYLTVHPSSGLTDPAYVKEQFLKAVDGLNIELIHDKSQNVKWDKPIDFLHIDGDHHYEEVKLDIEKFVPFVKSGCYVFFHDYVVTGGKEEDGRDEYGIVRALEESKDYFDEIYSNPSEMGFAICRKK